MEEGRCSDAIGGGGETGLDDFIVVLYGLFVVGLM